MMVMNQDQNSWLVQVSIYPVGGDVCDVFGGGAL